MKRPSFFLAILVGTLSGAAFAQESPPAGPAAGEEIEQELLKARREAEKAKAEAARARAEAERARAEAELLRLQMEGKRSVREKQPAVRQHRRPKRWPEYPGFHTHDGFFLRFALGPGFGGYNSTGHIPVPATNTVLADPQEKSMIVSGSFSIGGSIGPGLILHGDLWGAGQLGEGREVYLREVGFAAIGGGLTYYWMPENLYLTGSVGLASSFARIGPDNYFYRGDRQEEIGTGIAGALIFGKEWWVSPNWGVGFALGGYFAYTEGEDISLRQAGLKMLFSATFN